MATQLEARARKKAGSFQGALKAVEKQALATLKPVTVAAESALGQAEEVVDRLRTERPDQQLLKRADKWWGRVSKKLVGLQRRVIEGTGFASQAQLRDLSRDISKLSKKLDGLNAR